MIEVTPIIEIQNQYGILLKPYYDRLAHGNLSKTDIRVLLEETQLLWYKYRAQCNYFFKNLTAHDAVAFLADGVFLDIKNNGHFEFCMLGKHRIVNDPLTKLSVFYKDDFEQINFDYMNSYIEQALCDLYSIVKYYSEDFWILPLNEINDTDKQDLSERFHELAENLLISLFKEPVKSVSDIYTNCTSFEDISDALPPHHEHNLIYCDFTDVNLPLRKRIQKYVANNKMLNYIPQNEVDQFLTFTTQNLVQMIYIIEISATFHIIPFIRNDVAFSFLTMLRPDINGLMPPSVFKESVIAFILKKSLFFNNYDYTTFKNCIENNRLMEHMLNYVENNNINLLRTKINVILDEAEQYINSHL